MTLLIHIVSYPLETIAIGRPGKAHTRCRAHRRQRAYSESAGEEPRRLTMRKANVNLSSRVIISLNPG